MPSPFPFRVLTKMAVGADNSNTSSDPLVRTFNNNKFVHQLCTAGFLVKEYNACAPLWVKIKDWLKEGAPTNCLINHGAVILLPKVAETYLHSCTFSVENVPLKTLLFGFQGMNLHFKLEEWSPLASISPTGSKETGSPRQIKFQVFRQ